MDPLGVVAEGELQSAWQTSWKNPDTAYFALAFHCSLLFIISVVLSKAPSAVLADFCHLFGFDSVGGEIISAPFLLLVNENSELKEGVMFLLWLAVLVLVANPAISALRAGAWPSAEDYIPMVGSRAASTTWLLLLAFQQISPTITSMGVAHCFILVAVSAILIYVAIIISVSFFSRLLGSFFCRAALRPVNLIYMSLAMSVTAIVAVTVIPVLVLLIWLLDPRGRIVQSGH